MKLLRLFASCLLALIAVACTPAQAQEYGFYRRFYDSSWLHGTKFKLFQLTDATARLSFTIDEITATDQEFQTLWLGVGVTATATRVFGTSVDGWITAGGVYRILNAADSSPPGSAISDLFFGFGIRLPLRL